MPSKGRLAEQSEATRAALIAAARAVFAEKGYAATTIEDIVRRAVVTRGALYHHFTSKEELFGAVYETLEAELAEQSVRAAMAGSDPLDRLRRGIDAYLDSCMDPAVQRIVLLDGLSVLGWETWHALGSKYSFLVLKLGLEAAMTAGQIAARPAEPLTHLIQGALIQAGMVLARSADPASARPTIGAEIHNLLAGLGSP